MLVCRDGEYQFFNIGAKTYSCYCVTYKDKAVMIDCGPLPEREAIEKNMQKDFIFDVDAIFLTHAHGDTAGNAEYFSMLYNCPVYAMKDSLETLKRGICKAPPKNHPYIKKAGPSGGIVAKLPAFMPFEPCRNLEVLTKKTAEDLLGKDVMLLMTPGHTEDSISLKIGETALIGDAAQYSKQVLAPIFVDNEAQLGRSWQTLLGLSCKQYLCAHGKAFSADEWKSDAEKTANR